MRCRRAHTPPPRSTRPATHTVAWVDSRGNVDYAYDAAGSSGFVSGQIPGSGNPDGASSPQVAMDSGGNAWLLWSVAGAPFGLAPSVYAAYLPVASLADAGAPTWTARMESPAGPRYSASLATDPSGSAVIAAFTRADDSTIGIAYAQVGQRVVQHPDRSGGEPRPWRYGKPIDRTRRCGRRRARVG